MDISNREKINPSPTVKQEEVDMSIEKAGEPFAIEISLEFLQQLAETVETGPVLQPKQKHSKFAIVSKPHESVSTAVIVAQLKPTEQRVRIQGIQTF